jgi:hypothetical protein
MVQLLIISTTLIFSISCLHAEVPAESKPKTITPPWELYWELYDTNKDGYISPEEATQQKIPPQTFKSLDIDRDGRLNKDEFSAAPPIQLD